MSITPYGLCTETRDFTGGEIHRRQLERYEASSEGLGNNDIATRLFVSPRTLQTHLTHV
jgi:DNA-binding CsgD family transcriptional regulator